MEIRRAERGDIKKISSLLWQVNMIHHNGRPDIFRYGGRKYTAAQLEEIISDCEKPVFVAIENGEVAGYALCFFQRHSGDNILTDITSLYIDDLCVDESCRGRHIGTALYNHVKNFAAENGCYNITLNVWSLNPGAVKFYESLGMKVQKFCMEDII